MTPKVDFVISLNEVQMNCVFNEPAKQAEACRPGRSEAKPWVKGSDYLKSPL